MANASRRTQWCGQLLFLATGLLMLATLASDSKSQGTTQKGNTAPPQVFNDILAKGIEGVDVVAPRTLARTFSASNSIGTSFRIVSLPVLH